MARLVATSTPPSPGDEEQVAAPSRATLLVYPLVTVASAHFAPAALVLYWVTSNLVGAVQQWVVNRLFLRPRPRPVT